MRVVVALAAVLALAGCGIPQDDAPRPLDRAAAPFQVFEPAEVPPPQGDQQAVLWFVRDSQAVPVVRAVESPASPRRLLEQLLAGLTRAELAAGYTSAIPTSLRLLDLDVAKGIAVVTLEGLNEQVQVEAYAQIVATLDGLPGVNGVRFRDPDGDVPVPDGAGVLEAGAVTRDDYAVLLGLVPSASATTPVPDAVPTG